MVRFTYNFTFPHVATRVTTCGYDNTTRGYTRGKVWHHAITMNLSRMAVANSTRGQLLYSMASRMVVGNSMVGGDGDTWNHLTTTV